MSGQRIYNLDGLRLVAAMAVVLFHFVFHGPVMQTIPAVERSGWMVGAAQYGYLGVSVFFLISGYVIAYSANGRSALEFAIARFTRLYPTFALIMSLTALVTLLFGAPHFYTGSQQYLANLTMMAPAFGQKYMDGAYWSITLELVFYFWVFVLLTLGLFQRYQLAIIAIWLGFSTIAEFVLNVTTFRQLFITEFCGFFAAGILIYRIRSGDGRIVTRLLLAAAFAHSMITTIVGTRAITDAVGVTFEPSVAALTLLGGYGLFTVAAFADRPLLPAAWLTFLGGLTYPLYLLHQQIGYIAIQQLGTGFTGTLPLVALIALLLFVSWLVSNYFERPLMPKLRQILRELSERMIPASFPLGRILNRVG